MSTEPERLRLSAAQVALMNEILSGADTEVMRIARALAEGRPQPDSDVEALVDALSAEMLGERGFDGEELTPYGVRVDDIVGIVQQMSESF